MITKLYTSGNLSKELLFDSLVTKYDLDIVLRVEHIIWNRSPVRFLKQYMKTNQQTLFGTYLNKPLTRM